VYLPSQTRSAASGGGRRTATRASSPRRCVRPGGSGRRYAPCAGHMHPSSWPRPASPAAHPLRTTTTATAPRTPSRATRSRPCRSWGSRAGSSARSTPMATPPFPSAPSTTRSSTPSAPIPSRTRARRTSSKPPGTRSSTPRDSSSARHPLTQRQAVRPGRHASRRAHRPGLLLRTRRRRERHRLEGLDLPRLLDRVRHQLQHRRRTDRVLRPHHLRSHRRLALERHRRPPPRTRGARLGRELDPGQLQDRRRARSRRPDRTRHRRWPHRPPQTPLTSARPARRTTSRSHPTGLPRTQARFFTLACHHPAAQAFRPRPVPGAASDHSSGTSRMFRNWIGVPSDCSAIVPATTSAPVP